MTLPLAASIKTYEPWNAYRSLSSPSSAAPPDTPSNRTPSRSIGLPYTSDPGCVSMTLDDFNPWVHFDCQSSLPVDWFNAITYGPMHFEPVHWPPCACEAACETAA